MGLRLSTEQPMKRMPTKARPYKTLSTYTSSDSAATDFSFYIHGETRCPIPKKHLTLIFVMGNVSSFMIQSTGESLPKTEENEDS